MASKSRIARMMAEETLLLFRNTTKVTPKISLYDFFDRAWEFLEPNRELSPNWHIELICEYLEEVSAGNVKKLLINIAPRHLKSRIVSVAWPAWEWLYKPHLRFMCLSYSGDLARTLNDERRGLIKSDWYQELAGGLALSESKDRIAEFSNSSKGIIIARGLDGSVTGFGGDRIIFDDPNDPNKIESRIVREATERKFKDYSVTRRDDPRNTAIVVIQQRTHEKDVSGYILKKLKGWEWLCLPTVAEDQQEIVFPKSGRRVIRKAGSYLHPARYGVDQADEDRDVLGSYIFAARHQQRPMPAEGGRIKYKWFQRYKQPPAIPVRVVQSWDTAQKAKAINDPWVCTTWAEWNGNYYLLDCFRQRMEFPQGLSAVKSLAAKWKPNAVLVEDKSSGQSVLQQLRQEGFSFNLIGTNPVADKQTRMDAETPAIEAGRVFLPESAQWLAEYEMELCLFPNNEHDDQVDSTSQFLAWSRNRGIKGADFSSV